MVVNTMSPGDANGDANGAGVVCPSPRASARTGPASKEPPDPAGTGGVGVEVRSINHSVKRQVGGRLQIMDKEKSIVSGNLWKLNSDGDAMEEEDWLLREFWLCPNGVMCYHSVREDKGLAMFQSRSIQAVKIIEVPTDEASRKYAFEMQPVVLARENRQKDPDMEWEGTFLAAETAEEYANWFKAFKWIQDPKSRPKPKVDYGECCLAGPTAWYNTLILPALKAREKKY